MPLSFWSVQARRSLVRHVVASLGLFPILAVSIESSYAQESLAAKLITWKKSKGTPPVTQHDHALEELAKHTDWLENHIGQWGSVSAKSPDVWGEARLTQYRHEIEEVLEPERKKFSADAVAGAQQISDSAVLAFALAAQTGSQGIPAPNIQVNSASTQDGKSSIKLDSTMSPVGSKVTDFSQGLLGKTIKLEQTQTIDQMVRYMQHVNQHRRINEGDDTADSPGYALNLVRIPVSILPGSVTKRGYGAEISITAKPYIGPSDSRRVRKMRYSQRFRGAV